MDDDVSFFGKTDGTVNHQSIRFDVIPAKAGICWYLGVRDSGSRPG
jgi:hypothetical protein